MGKIVEKKKKKKGRPSLLDIQRRNLRLQKEEEEHHHQQQNTTSPPTNPNSRRFTRRNPDPDVPATSDDNDDNIAEENNSNSKPTRREKKINSVNSPYLDLGLYGSDSNEEDDNNTTTTNRKKRKINAFTGSANKKSEKQLQNPKGTEKQQQHHITSLSGPTGNSNTPLPDKKLLVFILDRLQKKDTYGVYSEPVDPEELPDYFDYVDTPMDFETVRQKLEDGAYATLEQFETDVFLISSNAMLYNAPDTIYFRQARAIQELAKKDFQNLRQESDHEQEPKRRGRPPKKLLGNTSSERASLDATLTNSGDNALWSNSYNLRRGRLPDKYAYVDGSKRAPYGSRNSESYSWLSEQKFGKNDGVSGSSMKDFFGKYGNKQPILEDSRRSTYISSHPAAGSESSVLSTFDGEVKQLLPVGLHTEYGYARSLARFAANLGPVAWKIAAKKIERALPPGMKFGPGWIGDDEAPSVCISSLASSSKCPIPQQQTISSTQIPSSAAVPHSVELNGDAMLKQDYANCANNLSLDGHPDRAIPSTSPELEAVDNASTFSLTSNGSGPPFQIHESALVSPAMNGFTSGFGAGAAAFAVNNLGSDVSVHSRILEMASKSNFINVKPSNYSNVSGSSSTMPNSIPEVQAGSRILSQAHTGLNGIIPSQIPGSVPKSTVRLDASQPDLALQL